MARSHASSMLYHGCSLDLYLVDGGSVFVLDIFLDASHEDLNTYFTKYCEHPMHADG